MRISDWSSDVCSSDLDRRAHAGHGAGAALPGGHRTERRAGRLPAVRARFQRALRPDRPACRPRCRPGRTEGSGGAGAPRVDRKSTRLNPSPKAPLVIPLLHGKKKNHTTKSTMIQAQDIQELVSML